MTEIERLTRLLSRKRLLIFDFDGTLVDSSPLHDRAFNAAFARYGVRVDYPRIAGLTTDAAVNRIVSDARLVLDENERHRLVIEKQAIGRKLIETELRPIEGSVDFVRQAAKRFELALCTSASRRTLDLSLSRVGLDGFFDPIVTSEDVERGKPEPDMFLNALRNHRCDPASALVFEDAESGLEAARRAGIEAVRIEGRAEWSELNAALDCLLQ